jgi:repressor LexA
MKLRLKELRAKRKISQLKLALDLNMNQNSISRYETGEREADYETLLRFADYFGVSLEYMTGTTSSGAVGEGAMIPIIGEIRAGSPIITNETLLGREIADVGEPDEYFYLTIRGDSMKNIGMVHGSLVLFKKQQYAENGDIVACLVDGDSATVKRFHKEKKEVVLLPENEDYSPIHIPPEDFESGDARILGIAVEVKIKL